MSHNAPGAITLPVPKAEYDVNYMYELVRQLENAISELTDSKFINGGWTITTANLATARSVTLTSSSDVGQQFATLVDDLLRKGLIDGT
jgi:hypothetical protein